MSYHIYHPGHVQECPVILFKVPIGNLRAVLKILIVAVVLILFGSSCQVFAADIANNCAPHKCLANIFTECVVWFAKVTQVGETLWIVLNTNMEV